MAFLIPVAVAIALRIRLSPPWAEAATDIRFITSPAGGPPRAVAAPAYTAATVGIATAMSCRIRVNPLWN